MKANKFYKPPTLNERLTSLKYSVLFWKGRSKGVIRTRNITLEDIRIVFFPKTFHEKYSYLGSIPWRDDGDIFKAMEPLVIFMDYKVKPKLCPRWFLRFLNLFGNDNSIVRVRNRKLHNLFNDLTNGYKIVDYKTKWEWYDLRISIYGSPQMHELSDAIEYKFYNSGRRKDLADAIKKLDPDTKYHSGYTTDSLKEELDRLKNKTNTNE